MLRRLKSLKLNFLLNSLFRLTTKIPSKLCSIGPLWGNSFHKGPVMLKVFPCHGATCFLTHWGRVTHICVSKLASIVSDNGLSPGRRQAIIWTNAGILLIGPLGTNFSEILIEIHTFSIKKMRMKVSSAKRRPFCLGLSVLRCNLRSHGRKMIG